MNSKSILTAVWWVLIPLIFGAYLVHGETEDSRSPGNDKLPEVYKEIKKDPDDRSTGATINPSPSSGKGKFVEIENQFIKIKYFDRCGVWDEKMCKLDIAVNSSIESEFILNDNRGNKISEGRLLVGKNTIIIPYGPGFVKKNEHVYMLKLQKVDIPDNIMIELKLSYEYPSHSVFDYKTGIINPKENSRFQKQIKKRSYYNFDKKKFLKSGLTNVLLGVAILLAKSGRNNLKERVDQQSIRTSIDSSGKFISTFGIGFTVYGLSSIFRAFKKRELKGDTVDKKLRKQIEELKDQVFVLIRPTIKYQKKEDN